MADTAIEWADVVWNPTTGCDRVSPGCDHCYALTMAKRLKGMGSAKYQRDGDPRTSGPGFGITEHATALDAPLRWRKPRRIFVNSMSDLFHDGVSFSFLARVFGAMAACPQHTFQILTKRPGRMRSWLNEGGFRASVWDHYRSLTNGARDDWAWPLPNVWLGVSTEDQKRADLRIPALLATPAAVRWISAEPLLGPIDLTRIAADHGKVVFDVLAKRYGVPGRWHAESAARLDWVVAGGESGPEARPMHPDWPIQLRDQCYHAGVPYLFKQWGEWSPHQPTDWPVQDWWRNPDRNLYVEHDGATTPIGQAVDFGDRETAMYRVGKHAAGRELACETWDQYPDVAALTAHRSPDTSG